MERLGFFMRDLLELRDEIDQIDSQIVDLYERRMAISEEVAEYKIAVEKKVFDKQREVSKLETLSRKGTTPFLKHGIRELFEQIMSMSRKRQYQLLTEHGQTENPILKKWIIWITKMLKSYFRERRARIPSLR